MLTLPLARLACSGLLSSALLLMACGGADSDASSTDLADSGILTSASSESSSGVEVSSSAASSGDGSSSETQATDEGQDDGCASTTVMSTAIPPNVVLVLDYSSSMTASISGLFGDSRWTALWDATDYATANYDDRINFGAMTFPDMAVTTNNSCETMIVEVPVAPLNGSLVMATIPPREFSPPGNTPTHAGLMTAAAHLASLDLEIPQALILVTDGAALCKPGASNQETPDDTVADYVGALADQNIPTYVIGMSNLSQSARDQLNDMAQQSGVPNPNGPESFYSADDLAQLEAAFDTVAGQVISCTIELEFSPPNPDYVTVEVDGELVPYVESCEGMNGWTFVPDTDNLFIELCGSACTDFQQGGEVHVVQDCPPQG